VTRQEALENVRTVARDNMDAMLANPGDEGVAAEADNYMHRVTKRALQAGCDIDAVVRAQQAGIRAAGVPVPAGR
jgi:hypothetical protein